MKKARLEAFSDGVFAILITIMVLELRAPHGHDLAALRPVLPTFLAYLLSFVYLGIYWTNHHHLIYVTRRINGATLWANLHLMFWLSLVPFVTSWLGEAHPAPVPTAIYGVVLLAAGMAYTILVRVLLKYEGPHSPLAHAIGRDLKGNLSIVLYAVAIVLAFVRAWMAEALYVTVAAVWLVPDRRIERKLPVDEE